MKKMLISLLTVFSLFVITLYNIPEVNAQSGEGVYLCTYWSSSGFESRKQCDNYYQYIQNTEGKKWNDKIVKCAKSSAIDNIPIATIKAQLGLGIKGSALKFGWDFVRCMFD